MVTEITSTEQYDKTINSDKVTIVLFFADWAEQCLQNLDVMRDLTGKDDFKNLQFVYIQAEEFADISLKHQVELVPTIIFFQKGSAIDRIDGVDIASLSSKCKELAGASSSTQNGHENLEDRLRALINKSKLMVFIKGDRNTPRCGFSKQLISILNDTNLKYETFDILTDEEVRQGLKTFSDWPTYPQVYVNGELIGGLDIIKELLASNELISTLNG